MSETLSKGKNTSDLRPPPADQSNSVMRRFLESGEEFRWPTDVGECHDNHCNLFPKAPIPLEWHKRISDRKASIDIYKGDVRFSFKQPFVVKTIRDSSYIKSRTKASHEVETMRDLRHPHVAALLGTFLYLDRLSILIFPAACCDLHRYMKSIMKELVDIRQEKSPLAEMRSLSDGRQTPDSTTSSVNGRHIVGNAAASLSKEGLNGAYSHHDYSWPLALPYLTKLDSLRCYFVCLSQALSYIHGSDVRHKDIKPENILVDSSGSVIITDFGISRSFPKQAPHVTNDKWEWTRKYASPEIMKGKKAPRDDPSDVFSLGCVFLEIATLVLGRSLDSFTQHYATQKNETGIEDAYHCNLERVHTWIDFLKQTSEAEQRITKTLVNAQIESHDFVDETNDNDQRMISALDAIQEMLDEAPQARPKAKDLWERFKSVSSERCRDCDPRHEEVWKPSETQKQNNEEGKSNRRSMHMISEETSDGPQLGNGDNTLRFGGIDSSLLSAQDGRASYRQRRSSSPHITRRAGSPLAVPNGQAPTVAHVKRASSPDSRWQYSYNRVSNTTSSPPRPPTPTMSAHGLTKTTSHPRSPSPQKGRPYIENRNHSGILQDPPSVFKTQHMHKRSSITPTPVPPASPSASRQTLKSNSGDLPEKQAQHTASNGTQNGTPPEEEIPPLKEVIIYDYSGELVYIAPFATLKSRDYRSYPLPKAVQIAEIGEKPKIIAKVDLSSLGWWVNRVRRMKGDFARIYKSVQSDMPLSQPGEWNEYRK